MNSPTVREYMNRIFSNNPLNWGIIQIIDCTNPESVWEIFAHSSGEFLLPIDNPELLDKHIAIVEAEYLGKDQVNYWFQVE